MQLNLSNNFKSVKLTCHFLIRSEESETELKTKTLKNSRVTNADSSVINNLQINCASLFTLNARPHATCTIAASAYISRSGFVHNLISPAFTKAYRL